MAPAIACIASGIRNPVGLALQPGTDTIWTAMNERDNLGDDLVPDYATSVKDGGFYGWPYSYIGKNYDPRYVGRVPGSRQARHRAGRADSRRIPPRSASPSTPAPSSRSGIATARSWRCTDRGTARWPPATRWSFFPMTNGKPGPIEDFLTGFLASDGSNGTPIERMGTPGRRHRGPRRLLLVSDDGGNRIWKISAAR